MNTHSEHELAEALESYTNPADPEFDPEFTREIFGLRPDWFSDEERARVAPYLATN